MGSGPGTCGCALDAFVRALTSSGTDVFVGTEGSDVDGIAQADHVVKWNRSTLEWSAMGSNTGGANGWFPPGTNIYGLTSGYLHVFATGTFQDADGDPRADNVAVFDGTQWHPVGSDGSGNGPWVGEGSALAIVGKELYAAGNFTSAGGDLQAQSAASFPLTQVIAFPTPTVTAGPAPVATPTVTPSPLPAGPAPDVTPPETSILSRKINQARRKVKFRFASSEPGSTFACKLERRRFRPCASPKRYRKLERRRHVFRVKARDAAGNVDATPAVKRFRIKRR